jgi:hypothetical protein
MTPIGGRIAPAIRNSHEAELMQLTICVTQDAKAVWTPAVF